MQHARNFPYLSHMQPGIDSVMRLDGHTSSEFSSRPPCAELTRFFWHVLAAGALQSFLAECASENDRRLGPRPEALGRRWRWAQSFASVPSGHPRYRDDLWLDLPQGWCLDLISKTDLRNCLTSGRRAA